MYSWCVVCHEGSVRLLQEENGTSVVYNGSTVSIRGQVQVCVDGYWSSVCDVYPIDPLGPELMCHSMGYEGIYCTLCASYIVLTIGGRVVSSDYPNEYGYSLQLLTDIDCSDCSSSYCSLYDCHWSLTNDTQCLFGPHHVTVECYNGTVH